MENPLRQHPSLRRFAWRYLLVLTGITLFAALFWWALPIYFPELPDRILGHLDPRTLATYVLVGFIAQLIDGSLGMAYGVTSTSFLMSAGVPPALASASVHAAEVCTTGASGMSHWRFGNVDKKLFRKLALPGALGAMAGAWFLSSVDGERIKPFVAAYLLCMGGIVLKRALKGKPKVGKPRRAGLLALIGGFVDASGGGGWGPVVNSTLMAQGGIARYTIGTVNAVEFIVALAASGVFFLFMGISAPGIILGLIVGGVLAAPLGALLISRIPQRTAMIVVGLLIIGLSLYNLAHHFGA